MTLDKSNRVQEEISGKVDMFLTLKRETEKEGVVSFFDADLINIMKTTSHQKRSVQNSQLSTIERRMLALKKRGLAASTSSMTHR